MKNIIPVKKDYYALIHEKKQFEKIVLIDWSLGSTCNYKCSYCPKFLHDGSTPWVDSKLLLSWADKIIEHYEKLGRKCLFQFTGGEPTFHPDFKKIVTYLKENNSYVGIISNGSRPISWWKNIVREIDNINITYHGEFANIDEFEKKISFLASNTRVNINVTMDPKYFRERRIIVERLANLDLNLDISITPKPLLIDFGDKLYQYNDTQLNFINNFKKITIKNYKNQARGEMIQVRSDGRKLVKPANIIAARENNWYGWSCYIGLESLTINIQGDIYRGQCMVGGKIGNIHENLNINLPNKGIRCNKKICSCAGDILTTKINDLKKT